MHITHIEYKDVLAWLYTSLDVYRSGSFSAVNTTMGGFAGTIANMTTEILDTVNTVTL